MLQILQIYKEQGLYIRPLITAWAMALIHCLDYDGVYTLRHDKPAPWVTSSGMNPEFTDSCRSNLTSDILSVCGICFWTNVARVSFSYSHGAGPRTGSLVMLDFATQGNRPCAAIPFFPRRNSQGPCGIWLTFGKVRVYSAKQKFMRGPRLIVSGGFLWWFKFISKLWISFLFPFLPSCGSKITTTNIRHLPYAFLLVYRFCPG